ncbi:MAG: hypothetical protein IT548_14460 [Alphaproteobacteria bacterium]|nr:hypothetical protein [Alphaproteobacteria bacterium]
MKTKTVFAAAIGLAALSAAQAADHPCAEDAKARAQKLLQFHFTDGDMSEVGNIGIDDQVKVLAPVKAARGTGKFDVIEVIGYIYKAEYRIHLLYAQIPDSCVLMGQEILELSDPY